MPGNFNSLITILVILELKMREWDWVELLICFQFEPSSPAPRGWVLLTCCCCLLQARPVKTQNKNVTILKQSERPFPRLGGERATPERGVAGVLRKARACPLHSQQIRLGAARPHQRARCRAEDRQSHQKAQDSWRRHQGTCWSCLLIF